MVETLLQEKSSVTSGSSAKSGKRMRVDFSCGFLSEHLCPTCAPAPRLALRAIVLSVLHCPGPVLDSKLVLGQMSAVAVEQTAALFLLC